MDTAESGSAIQSSNTAHRIKDSEIPMKISIKRSGGPRTSRGKRISSRNAIKHGFFSKDLLSAYRLDEESREDYLKLFKSLLDDLRPVGASELIQVELIAGHLFQYRSFKRLERALSLAKNTPDPDDYAGWQTRVGKSIADSQEGESSQQSQQKEPAEDETRVWREIHAQIDQWKSELPPMCFLDQLQRYENHILRNYYRAVSELERLQRMRLGEKVPPRMVVELHND